MKVHIVLSGPQGSGKTVLAYHIARHLHELGLESEVCIGNGAPAKDSLTVETNPLLLARLAAN